MVEALGKVQSAMCNTYHTGTAAHQIASLFKVKNSTCYQVKKSESRLIFQKWHATDSISIPR